MTTAVSELIHALHPGEALSHERLTVIPLFAPRESDVEYLTIDEAVDRAVTDVEEVDGGTVPTMRVRNRSSLPVLIPDGTALVGCKQNRVVNLSILIEAASETVIPVSCIEAGRWSRTSPRSSPSEYSDSRLRARMCRDTSASLGASGRVAVDQSGVWGHVDDLLRKSGSPSPSRSYHALYERADRGLGDYEKSLPFPPGAHGAAFLVDGRIVTVDLFDKPATFRKLWPKLLRALAVEALFETAPQGQDTDLDTFLSKALACKVDAYSPVGIGTNLRLTGDDLIGAALVRDGAVLHVSLFATAAKGASEAVA